MTIIPMPIFIPDDGNKDFIKELQKAYASMDKKVAEAVDRLYIKIYADDEPSVKAEKLYQICGETQKREVTEWLKEYFPYTEWIPCSERLPSEHEDVIVTVSDDSADSIWKYTTTAWRIDGIWISDNETVIGNVLAWMPLPKPYREDGE